MTPATQRACGSRPAAVLRHFVELSFNNIENLNAHLGLHDQLPVECRDDLGKMTEIDYEMKEDMGDRIVASFERKRYANSAERIRSWCQEKITLLGVALFLYFGNLRNFVYYLNFF